MSHTHFIKIKNFLLVACTAAAQFQIKAEEPGPERSGKLEPWQARIAALNASQLNTVDGKKQLEYSNSFFTSWNPSYHLSNEWKLVGGVGASVLNTFAGDRFVIIETSVSLGYHFSRQFSAEIGVSPQFWKEKAGLKIYPATKVAFPWKLPQGLGPINSIFFEFDNVFIPKHQTHLFMLGIQFSNSGEPLGL